MEIGQRRNSTKRNKKWFNKQEWKKNKRKYKKIIAGIETGYQKARDT